MKHFYLTLLSASLLIALSSSPAAAQEESTPEEEVESGAVVCPPQAYLAPPESCMPLGPSAYLSRMAQMGLTFPQRPLPIYRPSPELVKIPYHYFKLNPEAVEVYPSLVDAISKTGYSQVFPAGFVYVSYIDRTDTGHGVYYMLPSAEWIPGKGARVSEISNFQGLLFSSTPHNAFGWAFEDIPVKSAAGYNAPNTRQRISPFTVVQVYSSQSVDDAEWNLIGPDRWVEARKVATVTPLTMPPQGVNDGRWIEVNLAEQTLAVYENGQLVFATMVASGMDPFWTKPGLFQIFKKNEAEDMRGSDPADFYYLQNVPWTMYYDQSRALHGAYWRTRFGYPQSHGCVNLSVGDARWLFDWAKEGDWVYVHDPSGLTPTDPALYGVGAP